MNGSTDYTSPEAAELVADLVTVTVVDDNLERFHVTLPRRETADARLDAIMRHALGVRYPVRKPTGV